ncbi:NFX1-type zinc finger-containing protein 1 isoform X2 [Pygocentrus nattereri]|uniref:NFX1-type zinc finger-containing protein 1 isoform X2 n=1 Tax=Pygocentrus nattereri TaxID=42514 RepID=UPI0018913DD3|nr:NFX1-type zinc finger-containing protein 1 isoform X2 [Pygocentrus nattereri]
MENRQRGGGNEQPRREPGQRGEHGMPNQERQRDGTGRRGGAGEGAGRGRGGAGGGGRGRGGAGGGGGRERDGAGGGGRGRGGAGGGGGGRGGGRGRGQGGGGREEAGRDRGERRGENRINRRPDIQRERNGGGVAQRGRGGRGEGEGQRGRGDHGRGNSRDGTPEVRKLGYKRLEELLEKDASVVAITLSSSAELKALLDDRTMRQDLVHLLCQVLRKAFQSKNDRTILLHLVQVVKDSAFFQTVLPHYVTGIMIDYSIPARREQYPLHLDNIICLLADVVSMFPYSSVRSVSMLLAVLKPGVNLLRASGIDICDTINENLEKIQGMVDHLQEKAREGTLRSDNYTLLIGNEDAPPDGEDFRNMTIYPTPEEFQQDQKPFLRPNIMSQSYPSAYAYLDTHFRLLREDFVRPLREGIRELLRSQRDETLGKVPMRKRRFDDIRVYFDTRVIVPLCTPTGTAYIVQFDARPLEFVRWENSKRLLYGSLVCLSMDNFETFLFATVSDRDPALLRKGAVQLSFSRDSRAELARIPASESFLMVETTAYFEAYRYVLEGLQEQVEEDLPFQRYIVECNQDVLAPAYLTQLRTTYDLSCIAVEDHKDNMKPFNPLIPNAWPTEEDLGLDESQLKAVKLALTKELAIIQGPPGTGKTYVGLKIAQALLKNSEVWSESTPMLVVCYTNHALDQFLEGIHGFLKKGIVRVGGRSNSEILKRFSLRELTRSSSFHRDLPPHLKKAYSEIQSEMRTAEVQIQRQSAQMECSLRGIINEHFLQQYISDEHWYSLNLLPMMDEFPHVGEKLSMMKEWLGLGNSVFQQAEQAEQAAANGANEEGVAAEEEELLEMDEEAALIQAERIVVDAEPRERNARERKIEQEENLAELAEIMLAMNLDQIEEQPPQEQQQGQGQAADEEWKVQPHQKKKIKQMIQKELRKSSTMSEEEEEQVTNVWQLTLKNRWKLYRLWVLRYRIDLRTKSLEAEQVYQEAAERLSEIRRNEDLCVLRRAKVIGMTTTGAAKYRQALQALQPRLVVVEEAAEVLEAHTITTLSQDCQHLILIGDHQQLRPSATVYELAKNFNLEVSMFERLVTMDFPFVRLNYQHRMRPDIARLLTPHIYSELENHSSVLEYENIKGISTNLFFMDHKHLEEEIKDGRSHQNLHEAHFVVALCRYLLCQEYQPSQITILTTYTGQLYCLRKLMPSKEFTGVKVHVVDKYQGEENDIVILSLVRSNLVGKVGFLQIPNRVCVALSRAKKGLYCLGNMELFSKVKLWSNILHTLREKGQVGRALTLSCQNHPETRTLVSHAKDFAMVPEGGCNKPCEYRLDCGHVCIRMCHPYDADHKKYKCIKDCPKVLCELGHKCPRRCHQKCGDCMVRVEKVIPKCQHKQMIPCHQSPESFICKVPCQKTLSCGHLCQASCGEPCSAFCLVPVLMKLKCGHTQEEACSTSKDPTKQPPCRTKCNIVLKCGHPCSGTCHTCRQGRLHKACTYQCKSILPCSHECRVPCTRGCPPCTRPCENRCIHSVCKKKCGQPCVPCVEPCEWRCPHQSCTKLCHEPCDRPPCSEKCNKVLPCGHPCIGLCGDPCPKKCRICNHDEVTEIFFGSEDEPDACFIQLEDCGHIIESTAMDHYMGMDKDEEADLDQRAIRLKECPKCRKPIRRNVRYGAHVNRSQAEIDRVKVKIIGLQSDITQKQKDLKLFLERKVNFMQYLPAEYARVNENLQKSDLSLLDLWHQENLISFLERLGKLIKMQKDYMSFEKGQLFSLRVGECLKFLLDSTQRFSEQQVGDLESEMKRLAHLAELNIRCNKAGYTVTVMLVKVNAKVRQAREILEDNRPFTEENDLEVKRIFKELDAYLPCTGLGISDEERVMIVKAIGLTPGHWFKCPNGHVYAIGECGGAMQSGRCPECKATIGGANHTLTADNALATEMDGAQHAAWSEAVNLQNFDPMDF